MRLSKNQIRHLLLVVALGAAFAFYGALKMSRLHDTAALYIGLPMFLAAAVALIETKTARTTTYKVLTIAIALSPILIGEGFICMILAAPIMYSVAYIVGGLIDLARTYTNKKIPAAAGLAVICLLALEGTMPLTTPERLDEVSVEKTVNMSVHDVRTALSGPMKYDKKPKSFYTWLFLPPDRVTGTGLKPGDRRTVTMTYNKWIITNKWTGDITFEVAQSGPDFVTFHLVEDKSYMALYLDWQEATTRFERIDDKTTRVTQTIRYRRKLDPSWYFGPMERAAMRDAAQTIVDSL